MQHLPLLLLQDKCLHLSRLLPLEPPLLKLETYSSPHCGLLSRSIGFSFRPVSLAGRTPVKPRRIVAYPRSTSMCVNLTSQCFESSYSGPRPIPVRFKSKRPVGSPLSRCLSRSWSSRVRRLAMASHLGRRLSEVPESVTENAGLSLRRLSSKALTAKQCPLKDMCMEHWFSARRALLSRHRLI